MSLRQLGVAALAVLGRANAANSCCFVVQDEAHEVYWLEYATYIYTSAVNLTSITTLLTPYPTTTITNYETHVYLTNKVFTTRALVTENPVSLYPNPAFAIPQKTEILDILVPTATGGVTIASPTGFWVYSTAKVFAAPAVTDSNGNVACGTLSSFANVPSDVAACVPTFTGINENAAAYYGGNVGQGVEISLTTPFIHVPTRATLQISPSEACAQGNGSQNYGYPVQQLINHLASNDFYRAQYPGIENCIPAGPSIQAAAALAVALETDPPGLTLGVSASLCTADCGSTETGGGDLTPTSSIVITVTPTGPTTSDTATTSDSSSLVTTTSAEPGSTSTTLVTTTSVPTALPESTSSTSSDFSGGIETPISSGGLLPDTSTSTPPPESVTSQPASSSSQSSFQPTALSAVSEPPSSITSPSIVTSNPGQITPGPLSSMTVVISGKTTVVSVASTRAGGPTPVAGFSAKQYIPWELMMGLMGLVVVRAW